MEILHSISLLRRNAEAEDTTTRDYISSATVKIDFEQLATRSEIRRKVHDFGLAERYKTDKQQWVRCAAGLPLLPADELG